MSDVAEVHSAKRLGFESSIRAVYGVSKNACGFRRIEAMLGLCSVEERPAKLRSKREQMPRMVVG